MVKLIYDSVKENCFRFGNAPVFAGVKTKRKTLTKQQRAALNACNFALAQEDRLLRAVKEAMQ